MAPAPGVPVGFLTTRVRWLAHSGQRIPTGVGVMQSGQIGRPQEEQETRVSRSGGREQVSAIGRSSLQSPPVGAPSPPRLYAALAGALLLVLGVVGFFYDASFGSLDAYEEALGTLQVNGWLNLFYVATGEIGVLVAGASSRGYALAVGALYVVLAIVGWG